MKKFKAVVFDIDGTLTPDVSWTAFTRDIGGSVADHLAIYEGYAKGNIGYDQSKEQLLRMWQETGKATKDHLEELFERWPIKAEAQEVVDWLKEQGYKVCLITGSVGIYAKHTAQRLGIKDYYANAELHFDSSGQLTDFDYTLDQAEVKLQQLKEFCAKYDLGLQECAPVGDSNNDIELFRATSNGVLVVDGDKVAPELRQSAWKTIHHLTELKDLLQA